jgi:hypothetical protein
MEFGHSKFGVNTSKCYISCKIGEQEIGKEEMGEKETDQGGSDYKESFEFFFFFFYNNNTR